LLFNLADAISRALIERGIHLKQPALSDYATEPFIVFGKFLDEVEEKIHAPENRLILALDEFEAIEQIQYFNTAVPCRVSYLDEASARKLIIQPIDDFPLNYEPEAIDLLIEQTRCHPCLIQLTCQALVDMKNGQPSRHATVEDVEQALKKALHNDYALRGVWDWVPEDERPLLAWLASVETASIKQMARALLKPEAEARAMAEHLVKMEFDQRQMARK
jgi:hypothetical protein